MKEVVLKSLKNFIQEKNDESDCLLSQDSAEMVRGGDKDYVPIYDEETVKKIVHWTSPGILLDF